MHRGAGEPRHQYGYGQYLQRQVPVSHLVIAHPDASGQVDRFSSVMRDISDSVRDRAQTKLDQLRQVSLQLTPPTGSGLVPLPDDEFARTP